MRAPNFRGFVCPERSLYKLTQVMSWARAHLQDEFEVSVTASNLTDRCFGNPRLALEFKQHVCVLLVSVDNEIGRVRAD